MSGKKFYQNIEMLAVPNEPNHLARIVDLPAAGSVTPLTRLLYVDKNTTSVAQDGSIANPFDSIQDAIDAVGSAANADEYRQHWVIKIVSSGGAGGTPSDVYTENLSIPHRAITLVGNGVTIAGNIAREIVDAEEYVVLSSVWRACLALIGEGDCRDTHVSNREGIRVTGTYTEAIKLGDVGNTTHDLYLKNARIDGDITINTNVGNCVTYLINSRLGGSITTGTLYIQKAVDSLFSGTALSLGAIVKMENCEFAASGATTITTNSFDSTGWLINTKFNQATTWTISAAQTVKLDRVTYNSWKELVAYATNTPTISIIDNLDYSSAITWAGAGPYTFEITAATHKLGATDLLNVTVKESDAVVTCDVTITTGGVVTITSAVNFANGKVIITK